MSAHVTFLHLIVFPNSHILYTAVHDECQCVFPGIGNHTLPNSVQHASTEITHNTPIKPYESNGDEVQLHQSVGDLNDAMYMTLVLFDVGIGGTEALRCLSCRRRERGTSLQKCQLIQPKPALRCRPQSANISIVGNGPSSFQLCVCQSIGIIYFSLLC